MHAFLVSWAFSEKLRFAGSGVQGSLERNGSQRHVRFGAAKYATEVLGAEARARVATDAQDLASESVVSVFVDVADDRDQNGAHAQGDEIVRCFLISMTDPWLPGLGFLNCQHAI